MTKIKIKASRRKGKKYIFSLRGHNNPIIKPFIRGGGKEKERGEGGEK